MFRDLMRRPFWATGLALFGLAAACGNTSTTGLDLPEATLQGTDDDYSSFIYRKVDSHASLPHQYLSTWGSPWVSTDEGEVAYRQSLFLHQGGDYSLVTDEWYRSRGAQTGVVSVVANGRWRVEQGLLFLEGLGTAQKNAPVDDEPVDSLSLTLESSLSASLVDGHSYELVLVASNRGPSYYANCAFLPLVESLAECGYETCCHLIE